MEVTYSDLEEYFMNDDPEEWSERPLTGIDFDNLEQQIDDEELFNAVFTKYLSEGRLQFIDLPSASNYDLALSFSASGDLNDFSFTWTSLRTYEKPFKFADSVKTNNKLSDHIQPQSKSSVISESELEAILTHTSNAPALTDIHSAIKIIDSQNFNPDLSILSQIPALNNQISEDSDDFGALPLPNLSENANNQFAIEDNLDVGLFDSVVPIPAIKYPFALDEFQKKAIMRLEQRQNVFVAAHTSAGKTVVAEYAIALARERMSRVIYTSPIKALSNQKYREFKDQFTEIGILTGDVSVDEDSFCVIMTTEILRSMLYNNSSRLRDLEWVILDEVHYINDAERGVVWEEVLIMLPPHVRIVMLSATVPNYMEFSNWVGRVRNQKIYVQITYKRPVPLEHSMYVSNQFITIVGPDGFINPQNYTRAKKDLETEMEAKGKFIQAGNKPKQFKKKHYKKSEDQQYKELIMNLQKSELLPCVMFAFSRDKVDKRGEKLACVSLINEKEKFFINKFATRALKRLNPVDRELPQIIQVLGLLNRGIGIHHSGVLPILKEIVEILFSKGLLKILVATETFAMGLNMPTKTVVFCELRKFDGSEHRYLQPGEYTQMSGRAGRRGKDTKGTVIMFFKDVAKLPSATELQKIVQSKPLELLSKFRIRYNQIVNVLNTEGMDINEIMKKSFMEDQNFISKQTLSTRLLVIEKAMREVSGGNSDENLRIYCEKIKTLVELTQAADGFGKKFKPGVFVEVSIPGFCNIPALALQNSAYLLLDDTNKLKELGSFEGGSYEIRKNLTAKNILWVYTGGIPKKKDKSIKDPKYFNPQTVSSIYQDFLSINRAEVLTSDQIFKNVLATSNMRTELTRDLINSGLTQHKDRHQVMSGFEKSQDLRNEYERLLKERSSTDLMSSNEMESRIQILKKFSCINDNLVVQLKGKVLGIFNNPYNLVITEALFDGVFTELEPAEIAGVACVFITEEKSKIDELPKTLPFGLKDSIEKVKNLVKNLKEIEGDHRFISEIADQDIRLSMVEIVYLWAMGEAFVKICEKTNIKEGNIVRGILRVHDLLKNFAEAGVMMGDLKIKKKSSKAAELIQRDIAFATSLYISN